ncbi:hypothetical protein D3C73_1468580 [compost metagenome]
MDMRSADNSMSSASKPYMVATSSVMASLPLDAVARLSNIRLVSPAADTPFIENGLNLSKLVRRSGLARNSSPPLGASGFTKSKCVKSGGYFGVS